jgi:hypothetical protein
MKLKTDCIDFVPALQIPGIFKIPGISNRLFSLQSSSFVTHIPEALLHDLIIVLATQGSTRSGASRNGVPKPEFGNEKKTAQPVQ